MNYQEEIDFLVSHPERNKYICNLVNDMNGNTLVLFQLVEKHGNILYNILQNKFDKSRKLFFFCEPSVTHERDRIIVFSQDIKTVVCDSFTSSKSYPLPGSLIFVKLVTWIGAVVTLDSVLKDNAVPDKIVLSA